MYQVKEWSKHYENAKSRERDRCSFVVIPNKRGMGLAHILSEKDGTAILGAFLLVVEKLSTQHKPRQGWLSDDGTSGGRAWSASDLAVTFNRPVVEFERMLEVCQRAEVGWIVPDQYPTSTRPVPARCPGIEEKRIEGKRKEVSCALSSARFSYPDDFEEMWKAYPRQIGKKACFNKWARTIKRGAIASDLITASSNYGKSCEGKEPQYIKHGATFFGPDEHWRDYLNGPIIEDTGSSSIPAHVRAWAAGGKS